MSKSIIPPVPVDRWYNDLAAVKELHDILETVSFQKAVATLKEIAGPSFNTLKDDTHNSIRLAWYAGYRDAFNDLHKLTKIHNPKNTSTHPDEWDHIDS